MERYIVIYGLWMGQSISKYCIKENATMFLSIHLCNSNNNWWSHTWSSKKLKNELSGQARPALCPPHFFNELSGMN